MIVSLPYPHTAALDRFQSDCATLPFSYPERGFATRDNFPPGYDHDRNETAVGRGKADFATARAAIREYRHFPTDWTLAYAQNEAPRPGLDVVVLFRVFNLHWLNGARVVDVIDRPDYYGFSYGTLENHIERGEELFYCRLDPTDGRVYYGIQAYSRPRFWGTRLLKPYARAQQHRFVRESMARMREICAASPAFVQ